MEDAIFYDPLAESNSSARRRVEREGAPASRPMRIKGNGRQKHGLPSKQAHAKDAVVADLWALVRSRKQSRD